MHDAFADAQAWNIAPYDEERPPQKPAVVPVYLCPSTPGSPRLDRVSLAWNSKTASPFDGFATRDHVAIQIADEFPVGSWAAEYHWPESPGAWNAERYVRGRIPGKLAETSLHGFNGIVAGRGAKLRFITDGFSKTMLIGEQAGLPEYIGPPRETSNGARFDTGDFLGRDGLWWTSWMNSSYFTYTRHTINEMNLTHLYSFHPGGVHASMCDGSVRFLSEETAGLVFYRLFTRSGGTEE